MNAPNLSLLFHTLLTKRLHEKTEHHSVFKTVTMIKKQSDQNRIKTLITLMTKLLVSIPVIVCQPPPYHDYIHFQPHHHHHHPPPALHRHSFSSSSPSSSVRHPSPYFSSSSQFRNHLSPSASTSYPSHYAYQGEFSSPEASLSPPNIVRHPGTCTFQRSQPACTFSLLCYLAGGLPVEACEGDVGLTCCVLSSPSGNSILDSSPHLPPPPPSSSLPREEPLVSSYNSYPASVSSSSSSGSSPASSLGSSLSPQSSPSSSPEGSLYHADLYPTYDSNSVIPQSPMSQQQHPPPAPFYSRLPSSQESTSSGSSHNPDQFGRGYNYNIPVNYQKQAQHHTVQHVAPPHNNNAPSNPVSNSVSPSMPLENSRPHSSTVSSNSLAIPAATPMIHSYPHVLPVPASSISSSSSMMKTPSTTDLPTSLSFSSSPSSSLASPTSVQTPSSSVNSLFDPDTNVRRSIPSTSSLSSGQGANSLSEFIVRNQHARNFAGEDVCGRPTAKPRSRIIGGQDAFFGEFPWQVHIKIAKHQCGGALVGRQFVVTAAHCVYQAPLHQLSIIIGAHDIEDHRFQDEPPQFFSVAEVRLHPSFRFSASHPDRFDVAVLKLDKAARYNDNVLPVCLPPKGVSFEGWYGVVTGWGKTDPALSNRYGTRLLQKVDVPIIKNPECESWHHTRGIDLKIFPEMFCAGYEDGQKDACVGDSGGPLVVFLNNRWTLAGITSAGFGCAQSRQPGIYHRLPVTVDWVLANIVS